MKKKLLIASAVVLIVVMILFLVYVTIKSHGKNKLMQNDKTPALPKVEEKEEITEGNVTVEPDNASDYSVKYNGKKYKYNENIINVLMIGVDTDEKKQETLYGIGGQADVLLLGCINPDADEVKLISIPRDTICDVVVCDYNGEAVGTQRLPISLSHAYGDGGVKSAELTVNAVSELLYGLPIHAWYSLNVDSIRIINDAVGGVPIIADENNIKYLPKTVKIGDEYLLKNHRARMFVVNRDIEKETDSVRRIRHKQYLSSFIKQAKKAFSNNPLIVVDIYKKLNDFSLTSLTLDEVVWLAGEVVGMDISTDFTALKGKEIQGETMTEFHVDEENLYETMLDIFYIEVE